MQLSWPYFTLCLAGTLKVFSPSIAFLFPSLTPSLPPPLTLLRGSTRHDFLISPTCWDSRAKVKSVLCDQCFPDSRSHFNRDIISPHRSAETGVPSPFWFPSITFVLHFSPHLSVSPEVWGCYLSLPGERTPQGKGREKVCGVKRGRALTRRLVTWCRMQDKVRSMHIDWVNPSRKHKSLPNHNFCSIWTFFEYYPSF